LWREEPGIDFPPVTPLLESRETLSGFPAQIEIFGTDVFVRIAHYVMKSR
jgi:hypothetical protein